MYIKPYINFINEDKNYMSWFSDLLNSSNWQVLVHDTDNNINLKSYTDYHTMDLIFINKDSQKLIVLETWRIFLFVSDDIIKEFNKYGILDIDEIKKIIIKEFSKYLSINVLDSQIWYHLEWVVNMLSRKLDHIIFKDQDFLNSYKIDNLL